MENQQFRGSGQILDDLKAGKKVEREPVYSQTANSHGENDYGNSYVEINLTAQHLFLYKDGVLVTESDLYPETWQKGTQHQAEHLCLPIKH